MTSTTSKKETKRYITYFLQFDHSNTQDEKINSMVSIITNYWGRDKMKNAKLINKLYVERSIGIISIIYTGKINLVKKKDLTKLSAIPLKISKTIRKKFNTGML